MAINTKTSNGVRKNVGILVENLSQCLARTVVKVDLVREKTCSRRNARRRWPAPGKIISKRGNVNRIRLFGANTQTTIRVTGRLRLTILVSKLAGFSHIEEETVKHLLWPALVALSLLNAHGTRAQDVTLVAPGGIRCAIDRITPDFNRTSGYTLKATIGTGGATHQQVVNGEPFDVPVVQPPYQDVLASGNVVPSSETPLATVAIVAVVRKGDPKPDISTVDAFLIALLRAKVVAYADPALGGSTSILVGQLMRSLDVTGSIGPKTKLTPPAKPLLDLVAAGGVDIGFNPISEILSDPRLDLVGPLPAAVQKYTNYVASLVATSHEQDAFRALVAFLASPEATAVLRSKGFEPL